MLASHSWKLTSWQCLNVWFRTAQRWVGVSFNFLDFGFMFESWGTPTAGTPRNGGMTPKNGTPRNTTPRNGTPRKGATPRNEAGQFHLQETSPLWESCGVLQELWGCSKISCYIYHQKPGNDSIQVVERCFATATVIIRSGMGIESEISLHDLTLHAIFINIMFMIEYSRVYFVISFPSLTLCHSGHLFFRLTSSDSL